VAGATTGIGVEPQWFMSTRAYSETVGGSYYFLDETALGRQEDWEEPKGRAVDARGAVPDF
jgi:predicted dithiol-disulfide oxidoreductase (DUF899 family)